MDYFRYQRNLAKTIRQEKRKAFWIEFIWYMAGMFLMAMFVVLVLVFIAIFQK